MAVIFTNFAKANVASFAGATIKMALFHQAPSFANNDPRYVGIQTVTQLRNLLGWTEASVAGYPNDTERVLGTTTQGDNVWLMMPDLAVDDDIQPVFVRAVAFFLKGTVGGVANPVIMITTTPVGSGLVLTGGDRIAPRPDLKMGLPLANSKWVISWDATNPGNSLQEGPLATQKSAPEFEPSHTQHVWLYPQRVNFIANPSGEGGVNHWRSNGTVTQISLTEAEDEGVKALQFAGTPPIVVESNRFPALSPQFTAQLMARGTGKLKVGLVTWPVEYNETDVDWGYFEEWQMAGTDASIHVQALRSAPQPYECMLRIESATSPLVINNVLVENGYLAHDSHWRYFDGDTTYGARDDFSWYGGENLKGQTYSCWYNNRRATAGRLFATQFVDRAAVTSEEELTEGLVYRWVPAGVIVEPHWDVLFPNDLRHPIQDVAGTAVTPYKVAAPGTPAWAADMGVASPWLT